MGGAGLARPRSAPAAAALPFLVFGFCGIFCYRVLGAPRLMLRDRDLVSTGVFQTSTVPYVQILRIDASNGITLHLRSGEEVFLEGMPTSLFQAITGDRRSARLHSVLERRVADASASELTRPRVRKTVRPFVGQVVLTAGVFSATYLVALLVKFS